MNNDGRQEIAVVIETQLIVIKYTGSSWNVCAIGNVNSGGIDACDIDSDGIVEIAVPQSLREFYRDDEPRNISD